MSQQKVTKNFDVLIIGGGVMGLATARALKQATPHSTVAIIEKESDIAFHASGRNSGVLHAGFYYAADSLKARFTKQGNQALRQVCRDHNLRINDCGKLVVATSEADLAGLTELKRRGDVNGIALEWVSTTEAERIEPNVRTIDRALYSPTTGTVDPKEVCRAMARELQDSGVHFFTSTSYKSYDGQNIFTDRGIFTAGYIINCAGLYADKIAKDFGFGKGLSIIPFKGLYLKYTGHEMKLRTNIYPVPVLANPFLGVHFTITVDGHIKIGPTATPAFWRENYRGFERFQFAELAQNLWQQTRLFTTNSFGYRNLAWEESKKYLRSHFINLASKMVKRIDANGFTTWTPPGIRAQLIDTKTLKLLQDFHIEGDDKSLHLLNAVSPAFTCSIPMAEHIVARMKIYREGDN